MPPGHIEVTLLDTRVSGRWRFDLSRPAAVIIDFLADDPIDVPGARVLERGTHSGFVPTPRLRLSVNGEAYDVVSSSEAVLGRNYSRPDHQRTYDTDDWGVAFHEARLRQCRRLLRGVTGDVCDLGSGLSIVYHTGPWPFTLHACDRDPEAVSALQSWGVDAHLAPADDPPFARSQFDALYAGEIVEHLPEPQASLRRWVELLKPGGRLVLTTPNRRHLLTRARRFEVVENPEHLFEWDLKQLKSAVKEAGARVDAVEGLIFQLPILIPGRGWRDLTPTLLNHVPGTPRWLVKGAMEAGRWFPSIAYNLAISAHKVR